MRMDDDIDLIEMYANNELRYIEFDGMRLPVLFFPPPTDPED
jgi:hypothetical protein